MKFIHDTNLGFPIEQADWQSIFIQGSCDVFGYNNVGQLSKELEEDINLFAYIPVACLYSERKVQDIRGLVQATTGGSGAATTSSLLVVRRRGNINELADLRGKIYGRINEYCTSSYFAPAIHLNENGFHFQDFFEEVIDVPVHPGNWQNQIDQVIKGGIDATMVDEGTWLSSPNNAVHTKVIGRMDGLPGPIIVAKSIENTKFLDLFKDALIKSKRDVSVMFSGFSEYDGSIVDTFFERVEKALN